MFSQNFGGYNEQTLRRFEKLISPEVPIIDCNESSIKGTAQHTMLDTLLDALLNGGCVGL